MSCPLPPSEALLDAWFALQGSAPMDASRQIGLWLRQNGVTFTGSLTVDRNKQAIVATDANDSSPRTQRTMDLRPGTFTGDFGPPEIVQADTALGGPGTSERTL